MSKSHCPPPSLGPTVPELFPKNKSTALAVYNCAIYLGRALSFGAVLAADELAGNKRSPEAVMTQVCVC